jgi:hypothetical protein
MERLVIEAESVSFPVGRGRGGSIRSKILFSPSSATDARFSASR